MSDSAIYHWTEGNLIIHDPTMHIAYEGPFNPELLPDSLEDGEHIKVKRDPLGFLREAWIEREGVRDGQWRRYDLEEKVLGEGFYHNNLMHGPMVFRSPEGKLLAETWFVNGLRQGRSFLFYPDGKIYAVLRYLDGERHGLQEYFYSNHAPKAILYYAEGRISNHPQWFPESLDA